MRTGKTDLVLTTLVYIFATIVHIAAWKYGCLAWELFSGAMFITGVVWGERGEYKWWELLVIWYSWPAQFVRVFLEVSA